jgi:hypothetical protein
MRIGGAGGEVAGASGIGSLVILPFPGEEKNIHRGDAETQRRTESKSESAEVAEDAEV